MSNEGVRRRHGEGPAKQWQRPDAPEKTELCFAVRDADALEASNVRLPGVGDLEAAIEDGSGAKVSTPRRQAAPLGCLRDVHDDNPDFAALGRRERLLQTLL